MNFVPADLINARSASNTKSNLDEHEVVSTLIALAQSNPSDSIAMANKMKAKNKSLKLLDYAIAVAECKRGNFDESQRLLNRLKRKNILPRAKYLALKANILAESGQIKQAIKLLSDKSVKDKELLMVRAQLLEREKQVQSAEITYRDIIEAYPNYAQAYIELCKLYFTFEKWDHCIQIVLQALQKFPDQKEVHQMAMNVSYSIGDFEQLERATRNFLDQYPNEPFAILHLIQAVFEQGRITEASDLLDKYAEIGRDNTLITSTAASVARASGNKEKCLSILNEGWDKFHSDDKFYWNACLLRLSCGDLEGGYKGLLRRLELESFKSDKRIFSQPRWTGEKLPADKTLLIWREQGIGDVLLFSSMIPELRAFADRIILEVDAKLVDLLGAAFPDITVRQAIFNRDMTSIHDDFDYHAPIGDLMIYLRPTMEAFTNQPKRYLDSDAVLKGEFKGWLDRLSNKPKIGICWRSSKKIGVRGKHYLSVEQVLPLLKSVDATFISLQYDDDSEERLFIEQQTGIKIYRPEKLDQFNDLLGVASLIDNLDFVLTAATAVQNIAGGLGVPTMIFGLRGHAMLLGQDEKQINNHPFHPNAQTILWSADADRMPYVENAAIYLRAALMFK